MMSLSPSTIRCGFRAANHLFSRANFTDHRLGFYSPGATTFFKNQYPFRKNVRNSSSECLDSTQSQNSESMPDDPPFVFNKYISYCAKLGSLELGIQLHCIIVKTGFRSNVFVATSLVDMYGKCGAIWEAQQLFDEMPKRNVVTWNSLISGYVKSRYPEMALEFFMVLLHMDGGLTPASFSAALVGCAQLKARKLGAQLHGLCMKASFGSDVVVGTTLIDMYSKCLDVETSRRVFDRLLDKNVVTWTSMIAGYSLKQQADEAMILTRNMIGLGLQPNVFTYNSLLRSFLFPVDFDHFQQLHCRIIREGLESNDYLSVSLMTIYSECGKTEDFLKICSGVKSWDQISWNAAIAGFSNLRDSQRALACYSKMRQEGISVDSFTLSSILKAIRIIAALQEGKQTHCIVFKFGCASNLGVQNGLISMYANCGEIVDAENVFLSMDQHDLVSWNSLLAGYACNGYGTKAVGLFEQMRKNMVKPDHATFLAVLTACSHIGLLEKGLEYFDMMRNDDSLQPPKVEHYACIVDLYGRAGYLHEAESFINSMSIKPGASVFKALLSACRLHGNKEIALRSATKLIELWPNDGAAYVLLSSVMGIGGYWDDSAELRKLVHDRGLKTQPAYSWI